MTRPISADEFRKFGVNTLDERQRFRAQQEQANWGTIASNRSGPGDDHNPYHNIIDQWEEASWHPRSPSDKRRWERIHAQAEAKRREIAARKEQELERLRREEDPEHQRAKETYVHHVNGIEPKTPEEQACYARALEALDRGDYSDMYVYLNKASDERLAEHDEGLADARKAQSDAELHRMKMEAENARLHQAAMKPPLREKGRKEILEEQLRELESGEEG
ncbi:MAG: hypothetical protein GX617_14280 [Lentisphaerae bacterium]|nr:hypothetical protein [Lentisphaerota bacterium]